MTIGINPKTGQPEVWAVPRQIWEYPINSGGYGASADMEKCLACGRPKGSWDDCDRWDCPLLLLNDMIYRDKLSQEDNWKCPGCGRARGAGCARYEASLRIKCYLLGGPSKEELNKETAQVGDGGIECIPLDELYGR